jgi:hypothetical protein
MTAKCQLCNATIQGHYIERDDMADPEFMPCGCPRSIPGHREGCAYQVRAYDDLSQRMWMHIGDNHRMQLDEGMLVQRRAAKLYAMNWATTNADLDQARVQWRTTLLMSLSVTTRHEGDPAAQFANQAAATPSEAEASDPPDGSNVKKSERKLSN